MKLYAVIFGSLLAGCSTRSTTSAPSGDPSSAAPAVAPVARIEPALPASKPATAAASAGAVLVPGSSIGPFRLGMSRREIADLGLPTRTPAGASSILVTGPYELLLNPKDELISVHRRLAYDEDGHPLTEPILLGGKVIAPSTTFDELRKLVPGCGEPVMMDGGTEAKCADHTDVVASGPPGIVGIQVARR